MTVGPKGDTGARGERGKEGRATTGFNNPSTWALAFALVLCFTLLAVSIHRNATAVAVATRALCSQKTDIDSRLKQTNTFVTRLDGQPFIMIGNVKYTRAELLKAQADLQREAKGLKDVSC